MRLLLILLLPTLIVSRSFDWGTYNPGAYINLRSKLQHFQSLRLDTINAGVLWGNAHELRADIPDSSIRFSYLYNDPGNFAVQEITDVHNSLNLTSVFTVDRSNENAWKLQLEGKFAPKSKYVKKQFVSLVFHIEMIGEKNLYAFVQEEGGVWVGKDQENKTLFSLSVDLPTDQEYLEAPMHYYCREVNDTRAFAWNAIDYAKGLLLNSRIKAKDPSAFGFLPNQTVGTGCNLLLLQTIVRTDFQVAYLFNQPKDLPDLEQLEEKFDSEIKEKFGSVQNVYTDFSRSVLSNLLGGIGYFTGSIRVAGKGKGEVKSLFTSTPSRITFPRGFLWDEGFHLLVTCRWSQSLCLEILRSWLNTQEESGWIPREQIRGQEAEGRVPAAFLVQNDTIANPPSLMFPILYLAQTLTTVPPEDLPENEVYKALKDFFPRLSKWLRWLYSTQLTDSLPAWSGRSSDHNLASGLDDYPRSQVVNAQERHVDLYCWLLFFSKGLSSVAQLLSLPEDRELFTQDYEKLRKKFETWFYDKESGLYNDYLGVQWVPKSTKKLRFSWRGDNQCGKEHPLPSGEASECNPYSDSPCCSEFGWCGNTQSHCKCPKCAKALPLNQRKEYSAVEMFSPHVGYVTLFPLIHGVLKIDDPAYAQLLKVIQDPAQLWTHYGLRSLSKSDDLYKTGENYWRGNIWININYLVLRALKVYYWEDPIARKVYSELRDNLITAVYIEWNSTRSLYEQYSDENGRGRRSRAFYGWSALTFLMLQEIY